MGKVFVTGATAPGRLYRIDPTESSGSVFVLSSSLGSFPNTLAYDGQRIWSANAGSTGLPGAPGSVSIVRVDSFSVTNVTSGFSHPSGIVFDGTNIWVTDPGDNKVKKLGSTGSILLSVTVGSLPRYPAFDGTNIWVPNFGSNSVSVVRVKDSHGDPLATPFVLATLTGNGLASPIAIAFDGERILVTNHNGHGVSL